MMKHHYGLLLGNSIINPHYKTNKRYRRWSRLFVNCYYFSSHCTVLCRRLEQIRYGHENSSEHSNWAIDNLGIRVSCLAFLDITIHWPWIITETDTEAIPFHRLQPIRIGVMLTFPYYGLLHLIGKKPRILSLAFPEH